MSTGIKKLKCPICDKKIVDLKRHVKTIHEGIKSHRCQICGVKFGQSGHLKVHVKTVHEGIKDYQCQMCDHKFSRSGHLKDHVKVVHEGIKNHQCQICDQKFGRSGSLKIHVKTVHEGILKDHQCQFCDQKFGQSGYLKRHVKRVHVHDRVDQSRSLLRKKHVNTTHKRSKNVKNTKRMKMLEKEALDISKIVGFDHENEIVGKEQKIKKDIKHEVKTEPVAENINKGIVNVEPTIILYLEPIDKNSGRMKMMEKQALDFSNIITGVDHFEEQKIKKEIKIEPIDEEIEKQALDVSNITGFDNIEEQIIKKEIKTEVKIETIDENVDEKQALDFSNITNFDHENQIEEQKIQKEIKIEPMDFNE